MPHHDARIGKAACGLVETDTMLGQVTGGFSGIPFEHELSIYIIRTGRKLCDGHFVTLLEKDLRRSKI